jgi:hypothetical protein
MFLSGFGRFKPFLTLPRFGRKFRVARSFAQRISAKTQYQQPILNANIKA